MLFQYGYPNAYVPALFIDNTAIERVENFKFLGIFIDNKLKWNCHITYVCSLIARNTGILYRLRSFLHPKVLLLLYYTLIQPYLIYGIEVWGSAYNNALTPIVRMQKKALRCIANCSWNSPSRELFNRYKVLSFHILYDYYLLLFVYKMMNRLCFVSPAYYNLKYVSPTYAFRKPETLIINPHKSTARAKFFGNHGAILWNKLPQTIVKNSSLCLFKGRLKSHLLNEQDKICS